MLLIPGPVELSPRVRAALATPPPSHNDPAFVRTFGDALRAMRAVWKVGPDFQPFVVPGSGTTAMDMVAANLVAPGDAVLVVDTGYFSDRMAKILERRGARVRRVRAEPGDTPVVTLEGERAVFATHVDTSTGVRLDVRALAERVRPTGALLVVDGVCALAGEACDQEAWGVDVVLTASQKALSLPPGLGLWMASPRALEARRRVPAPPLAWDVDEWLPIHRAYEEGRPSYFATPATGLVAALGIGLAELVEEGVDAVVARHADAGARMRRAWSALGLSLVPKGPEITANTLSALWYPEGVDQALVGRVAARGVAVAGGLHPEIRSRYFRVGHLGWVTSAPDALAVGVRAIGEALVESGHRCEPEAGVRALR
jgi:alanine-glyoxylate transaminase/serine-glyoxylate transaminase/serine-pyruvate transaminase